jgi:hypothetical protein
MFVAHSAFFIFRSCLAEVANFSTAEQKKLLVEARFDQLAKEGKGAVRKAIAKRRLKVSQKEKRSRPDGPGRGRQASSADTVKDDDRSDRRNKKRKLR